MIIKKKVNEKETRIFEILIISKDGESMEQMHKGVWKLEKV